MRKWQRLLALPIQCPQPGHFSSNDLEWSNVEDNNGQIFDCVSWIPRDRIDDFIKVVYLLYCYHQKHPVNLVLLAFFTVSLSLTVGISCAYSKGRFVLEALILTAAVVFSLTGYTFWASKKGKDFSFLGPVLFASLLVLILFGFIQIFFPLGSFSTTIYGGVAALIFSGYIVYDIDNLIKRYTYDQYIWASVVLYLDILNLFLSLLQLLWRSS